MHTIIFLAFAFMALEQSDFDDSQTIYTPNTWSTFLDWEVIPYESIIQIPDTLPDFTGSESTQLEVWVFVNKALDQLPYHYE